MTDPRGIILYGPPASGKSSITEELANMDPNYQLFKRLKIGQGRTEGYNMTTLRDLEKLRAQGVVVWENSRYGATYAISQIDLIDHLMAGVPIVHAGQPAAVSSIIKRFEGMFSTIELCCSYEETLHRLRLRNDSDLERRVEAWRETPRLPGPTLSINTEQTSVKAAAHIIVGLRL